MTRLPGMDAERTATISDDGLYRYDLTRRWDDRPWALWVMLNPSTADADQDDRTLFTIQQISRHNGHGGVAVVNLFAYRSRNPDELLSCADARGPENRETIKRWVTDDRVTAIVCGWGNWWHAHRNHPQRPPRLNVERTVLDSGKRLYSIGETKAGDPRHPLYARFDSPFRKYVPLWDRS